MSLPLLEQFEAQRASTQKRQSEEKLMRANGHNQAEIDQALAGGTHANPTAGPATANEREHPNYTPGQTLLGGGVTPGTRKADEEAGSESLLGKATKLLSPATEASENAGEKLGEAEKAEVKLPKLPNPLSWTEAIAKVFSKLTEGSFWVRVLKFILGAGLIVVAIFFFARAAGLGAETPVTAATQQASRAIAGGAHDRQTRVSTGTRQRVQAAARADEQRDRTPRGKSGKPLTGAALTNPARQRATVRRRDEQLPSVRQLRKNVK